MKKVLLIIGILILLLIVSAFLIPVLFKDRIVAAAKNEINKSINAKVTFGDFDLTLIRGFPNITFCMDSFCITGINEFEGDTLASVKSLDVRLNLWDVIGGSRMSIKSISLDEPYINIIVLKDGRANYDIAKPDTSAATGAASDYRMQLQSYAINKGKIVYDDRAAGFKMKLENIDHTGKGDFTQDLFTLSTRTAAEKTALWYGGVKYLSDVKTDLIADFEIDNKNFKYTFKENELSLNDLTLGFDGWIAIPDTNISMDLKWEIRKNDFKNFVSLIPGVYKKDFNDLKSSGSIAMNGFVKGTYNASTIPAYSFNLKIDKGMFQYPSLPAAMNNVNVDLAVNNPDGITDHTVINLKSMHAEFGSEPFDARLHVTTPVSDANIDAMAKGTINLANIKNMIPLESGTDLNGIIKADVSMKGRYSAIEQKQYQNFDASGTIGVTGMKYTVEGYPEASINNLLLTFNPANVTLNQLDAKMGKSDFKASGSIDNLLGYYFKDELLKGNFTMNSSVLDLNEMMSGSSTSTSAPDTSSLSVLEVPSNIDFNLNTSIDKIFYENLLIHNLSGVVGIRDQKIDITSVVFNMLNGSVNMSGNYSSENPVKPAFGYNVSLMNFDIQQTYNAFETIQQMAPIAKQCSGKFSTDLEVSGTLNQHMQPVMNTLSGKGVLTTQSVSVNNFEPLNKIADAIKMDQYKQLLLNDLKIAFEFKEGRVQVRPFQSTWKEAIAEIGGSNGFDQTIDYNVALSIPSSKIPPSATSAFTNALAKANNVAGTNMQLPEVIKVNLKVLGTILKPVVTTDFSKQGQAITETIKEAVEQKVEETIDKGKEEARAQADKILAEAKKQAQALRDAAQVSADQVKKQGYASADKLVADAKNPIAKAAANEASKKLKAETDKKAQAIIDEGNKKAQAVIDAAKKKSDELLK